jgi:sialidase-1
MSSKDDGKTWTWPRVLLDSAGDDRDAGVLETRSGALLVTTFSSTAYVPSLQKQIAAAREARKSTVPAAQLARWQAVHARMTDAEREADKGEWLIRSTDGGRTWSARLPTLVNSPHGPLQLRDGRLLYAGKQLWSAEKKVGVAVSTDDGQSWSWFAEIPTRPGDNARDSYHELHAVEADDGTLIVHIRNHNPQHARELLQTESRDGGRTWSVPHPIGVWGLPAHLLKLRDGKLLLSYGYRRAPFGNQARVSVDHGRTWSEALPISEDGSGGDLGYPSTVELGDGSLLTVWYEKIKSVPNAVLRQAHWRLDRR